MQKIVRNYLLVLGDVQEEILDCRKAASWTRFIVKTGLTIDEEAFASLGCMSQVLVQKEV